MSQDNRQLLWDREDHPSTELLRQYQQDALPPTLNHQLEEHLLDCEMCSDLMEGMELSDAPETRSAVRYINRLVASRARKKDKRRSLPLYMLDWRVAAAILLVFCSMVLVLYYNYKEVSTSKNSLASDSDKAIQESMDLAKEPAITSPEPMAEAVPDTLKPTIAAKPSAAQKRKLQKPEPTAGIAMPESLSDKEVKENGDSAFFSSGVPAIASAKTSQEKAELQTIALQKNTLVPESTSVAKALEGRLEGVPVERNKITSMNQLQGRVLSATGQPLPGVAVRIKGTNTGVATDAKGNFTLSLPSKEATLVFNYIGFNSEEKAVTTDTKDITVNLKEDTRALSEVVVSTRLPSTGTPVMIKAGPIVGEKAYADYLQKNIRYTSDFKKGRVVVRATVSQTGELQNLKVTKSLCPACDREAIRLVKEGPAWEPATNNGLPEEQDVKIVVRFKPPKQK